jgi:antitoxin component of MazEF toxin-antitoxin module
MVEVELKEWGNSIGVVLPIEKIREMGLRKGDKIEIKISLKKKIDGFGLAKGAKPFEEEKEVHEEFF